MSKMLDDRQFEFFPLSLLGQKPKSRSRLHKIFFALRPPTSLAAEIQRYATDLSARFDERRKAPANILHLTLNNVAAAPDFDEETILGVSQIGDAVSAPGFHLVLDRIMTFRRPMPPYPVVLTCADGTSEVRALYHAIAGEMERRGLRAPREEITPHVTLWYAQTTVPTRSLAHPFHWRVDDFWLIRSFVGQGRHEHPGHWRLTG